MALKTLTVVRVSPFCLVMIAINSAATQDRCDPWYPFINRYRVNVTVLEGTKTDKSQKIVQLITLFSDRMNLEAYYY